MLYIRKLFTQDLRDGKQIAFPKEVSYSFFCFDYINKEDDRKIKFTFRANFGQFQEFEGKEITTRLYAAGSESRMDGEVKAFIRDELKAQVDDLLIIKSKGTKHVDFDVMFVPKSNSQYYPLLLNLSFSENHSVYSTEEQIQEDCIDKLPLQQIYFGAPGTGKSHEIKSQIKKHKSFRITFHPDTDYSSFVGAYKPTSVEVPMLTPLGDKAIPMKDVDGNELTENKIIYTYVKQAFLNAYVEAWKERKNENPQPVFLVIEEINRGNCAQIFGDIFQLLDRNEAGFSDYAIVPDTDLSRHVKKDLEKLVIADREKINAIYEECEADMVDKVLKGEVLLLPNNLYIWATMNTSDQSLFPIDSAFKRRWDWKYNKIADAHKNWQIKIETKTYDWWQFVQAINYFVFDATQSEDKNLGYFFAKAKDNIINAETFVSKVIFYLYTDVFKDYGFSGDIFKGANDDEMTFQSFYNADGSPCEAQIIRFIENVMFSDALPDDLKANSLEESLEQTEGTLKFKVGDKYPVPQRQLAVTALKQFVDKYPNLTAKDVIDEWKSLSNISHFIESQVDHDNTIANAPSRINRTEKVDLSNGDSVYISLHGWIPSTSTDLMNAINAKDWGIEVTIISE